MQFIVKRKHVPVVLVAIGIALFLISQLIGNWFNWTPVSFPIDLKPSITHSEPFKVDLSANYLINLEVERTLPFEKLNCMLGIHVDLPDYCKTISSPVDLKWSVTSSGKETVEGTADQEHDGAWGSTIRRTIGRFPGEKGRTYVVGIESLGDASILSPTNPRIVIRAQTQSIKDFYVVGGIVVLLSISMILVGSLWWLVGIIRTGREKRTMPLV